MAPNAIVDQLGDLNKVLVGKLKEKEEELGLFRDGKWFEKEEVGRLVSEAVAGSREELERFKEVVGMRREEERERFLEVELRHLEEKKGWRKEKEMWEASLEVERRRVDDLSKLVSQHREVYHEEVLKGRTNEKRSLEDMVAQVVGGKKRKVEGEKKEGTTLDPEKAKPFQVKVGVKVGGVLWENGVEGVLVGLREMGFTICEGSRWLVGETEWTKRRDSGKNSSTVLAMIGGGARAAGELCKTGVWVGARWCSVKWFVAIPLSKGERNGWRRDLERVAKEVREELRGVVVEARAALCNQDSEGSLGDVGGIKGVSGSADGIVKQKEKGWKSGEKDNLKKAAEGFIDGFIGGMGVEEVEEIVGGDWVWDLEGNLLKADGRVQRQYTAYAWREEIRKATEWRKEVKGKGVVY